MTIATRLRAFLTLGSLAVVGSVVGIVGGGLTIANQLGGDSSSPSGNGSTGYVPQHQGDADTGFQDFFHQFQDALTKNGGNIQAALTAAQQATQPGGMFANNPQTTANVGNAFIDQAGQMQQGQRNLMATGDQVMNTAMDPQSALFAQMRGQVADAANANSSMRGIGMSPQAAGISNAADSNFLMNWQNQQLQRQIAGAGAQTGAYQGAGQLNAQGGNDLTSSINTLNTGAMMPYQLGQAAANLAQAGIYSPTAQGANLAGGYMTLGQQGGSNAFNQGQVGMNNLTTGLTQLGQSPLVQGIFSGGGGSNFNDDGYGVGFQSGL